MTLNLRKTLELYGLRFHPRWKFFHDIKDGKTILELGCGTGANYRFLEELSSTSVFHGVDILPSIEVPSQILYRVVDLNCDKLPYSDSTFDAILFTHVIEHLRNPLALGEEIHRVLRPNGVIYVETPNWTSLLVPSFSFRQEQGGPFNFLDDPTHVRPWTRYGLFAFLFQNCHLHVEGVSCIRSWIRVPWDVLKIFHALLTGNRLRVIAAFWNIFGWCIFAIGRKKS